MKSKINRKNNKLSPKVAKSKQIKKPRNFSEKRTRSKPKDLLDIDDSEMNELLNEFAEEEKKKNIIKFDDQENDLDSLVEEFAADDNSEDEFDSLLEEFAAADSDTEDEQTKSATKVILSSSDNEIDAILDDFKDEDLK